jgi:hypothetical protein
MHCNLTVEILWDYVVCTRTCMVGDMDSLVLSVTNVEGGVEMWHHILSTQPRLGASKTQGKQFVTMATRGGGISLCWLSIDLPGLLCIALPYPCLPGCLPMVQSKNCSPASCIPFSPQFYRCAHNWNRAVILPPPYREQFIACTWLQTRDALWWTSVLITIFKFVIIVTCVRQTSLWYI